MTAGIDLRPARDADLTAMLAIEREVFGPTAWSERQWADELARTTETRWYLIAEQGEVIVGYVGLYLSPPDADVQTLAVAADQRGGGLGRRLLTAAIDHAWALGCTRIFLEVSSANPAAQALYRAAGFVQLGRRSRYYPDGSDALIMRLRKHEVPDLAEAVRG